jgi:RNA polymerase sigma-70 factor (ECF subfamily)
VNDESSTGEPLLPAVARGDRQALQKCVDRYGPMVWAMARRLFRTPQDAEDGVQEVFLDLWKSAARFDPDRASERVFIAVCARRRLIDRLRKLGGPRGASPVKLGFSDEAPPVFRAERDREIAEAEALLEHLPPQQRQVLILSLVYGLTHQEIADQTNLPLGTVKTLLRRTVLQIRESDADAAAEEGGTL